MMDSTTALVVALPTSVAPPRVAKPLMTADERDNQPEHQQS